MILRMNLRNGLPVFLFFASLVGYANSRIPTEHTGDFETDDFKSFPGEIKADAAFRVVGNGGSSEIPFQRGVNLTNWLQAPSVRQIQFTKFTKQDFINIKRLGCDVIRLPINLHHMTSGLPNYIIDPLFFYFLDQIIDWAEELELHLILDNHTFDPAESTNPGIVYALIPVWTQMAQRYKDRSTYLYYEVLNEPHDISDAKRNEIQQEVVEAIREVDRKHTIIVGPADRHNGLRFCIQ